MPTVLVESVATIRILTLNRPDKLNAFNIDMQECLLEQLRVISADSEVRALILTGAGRAFCAGGDHSVRLEVISGGISRKREIARGVFETENCLMNLTIPVIAAVNGMAAGIGAGLVALCDMVVMGEGASLSDPHVKFGLPADPVAQFMWPRLTSRIVANQLLLSGREVTAKEAISLGLCNTICDNGKELAVALESAKVFSELPADGIAATKRMLQRELIAEFAGFFAAVSGV